MRLIIPLLLINLTIMGCTSKVKDYSTLSLEEKGQVPTMQMTNTILTKPIKLKEAQDMVTNYREFLDHKVNFEGGIFTSKMFLREVLHDSVKCLQCGSDTFGFPSYSISADTIREILKNEAVKKILLYPASHGKLGKKYAFTIVLVGSDESGKAVQRLRTGLKNKVNSRGEDDPEIWEYIDPCKPNCNQVH